MFRPEQLTVQDMSRFLRLSALAVLGAASLWLAACATPLPPRPQYPPITFQDQAPIGLDVSDVAVEVAYVAPAVPPNVDHLFPVLLSDAAQQWARDRLRAGGASFRARYVVQDASVVAVPLKTSSGLTGLVTKDQAERYDARVAAELLIYDSQGRQVASAQGQAVRSRTVREDITLTERDQVWYDMTKAIMADLDEQLAKTIKTSLFPYVQQ